MQYFAVFAAIAAVPAAARGQRAVWSRVARRAVARAMHARAECTAVVGARARAAGGAAPSGKAVTRAPAAAAAGNAHLPSSTALTFALALALAFALAVSAAVAAAVAAASAAAVAKARQATR